jgi:hypothetical protein
MQASTTTYVIPISPNNQDSSRRTGQSCPNKIPKLWPGWPKPRKNPFPGITFMIVQFAIRIGHFPGHFNQFDAFFLAIAVFDNPGEAQQLIGLGLLGDGKIMQLPRFFVIQAEFLPQQPVNRDLLTVAIITVHGRRLDQQRGGGQLQFVMAVAAGFIATLPRCAGKKHLDSIYHGAA